MAGKVSRPWYRKSKKTWYVCVGGKQVNLGKDKEEALQRFHKMMADLGEGGAEPDLTLTVRKLVKLYLEQAVRRLRQSTIRVTRG